MSDKTGGPAFPRPYSKNDWQDEHLYAQEGMTLRDYFAAKAMQGLLKGGGDFEKFSHLTADAYAIADAMLKGREL